jgi:hypothetical protein
MGNAKLHIFFFGKCARDGRDYGKSLPFIVERNPKNCQPASIYD